MPPSFFPAEWAPPDHLTPEISDANTAQQRYIMGRANAKLGFAMQNNGIP